MSAERLPVLVYHRVGPPTTGALPSLTVSPERFRSQLEWLRRRGWSTVGIDDVVAWQAGARRLGPRSVLLTFDDGYADLERYAAPALEATAHRAVLFAVSGMLGGRSTWDAGRASATHELMDAAALRRWTAVGHGLGAHGRTHRALTQLSHEEIEGELAGSRSELEDAVQATVASVAYPYGEVDATVAAAARRHYAVGFGMRQGLNLAGGDPLTMRRTMVQTNETRPDSWLRLRTGRSILHQARVRVGRARSTWASGSSK